MSNRSRPQASWFSATLLLISIGCLSGSQPLLATDYFLTIGGGYDRSGNQASLEANVVFFQRLLSDRHRGSRRHDIYFADGDDPVEDLQIVAEKPATSGLPATDLLASLHRRREEIDVIYRNHQVTEIAGPIDPALIKAGLDAFAGAARGGDRLIVYVTAHGSEGPRSDEFNTTIDCWNRRKISAREFTEWLDKLPADVPVVMVMAQCYCGGFAHTIFKGLDQAKGLAPQLRVGFFAQQHNLPAAGCRPDIEHDEEFSSYFWGALAGRTRNGVPIEGCDIDRNGVVSLAEAYAYAVIAGETIDIPLRASDVLLRTFSQLNAKPKTTTEAEKTPEGAGGSERSTEPSPSPTPSVDGAQEKSAPATMTGTLQTFVDRARPVSGRIVTELCKTLGIALQDDVASVMAANHEERRADRFPRRGGRRRLGSGRRDLLKEVREKWPELADDRHWAESSLLKTENQEQLLAELKNLPSWKAYDDRRQQMQAANDESEQRELRMVKYRRLINTLETIVLENNLPLVATPEIVERYRQMMALEESTLGFDTRRN
ncbi:MAG TPA: hypothetical protein VHC22_06905 [Pirellulales bacterium]|nr:hypothetical protein [Pirellulales bacterium]